MNSEVAKKWATALRTGEYGQTYGRLRETIDDCDEPSYCVLGVLCEVHRMETGAGAWKPEHGDVGDWKYLDEHGALPSIVQEWAGLDHDRTPIKVDLYSVLGDEAKADRPDGKCMASLEEANDEYGLSFEEFADLIEAQAERL